MPADDDPMVALDEVLSRIDAVDGWLTHGQARCLFEAALSVPDGGRIVEIGSFRGRSTIVLATAAAPTVEVIAIDPHAGNDRGPQEIVGFEAAAADDHAVFNRNLATAGVSGRVRHVRAFSDRAHDQVDSPIDVLYVDGAHRYGPARADIRDWGRRVRPGGAMLIHDSFSSIGVTAAILRELLAGGRWRYVGRSRSMAVYRADLRPGMAARLANAGRQAMQLGWFARNLALKALIAARLGGLMRRVTGRPVEWPY